jgi:hypothetical protein
MREVQNRAARGTNPGGLVAHLEEEISNVITNSGIADEEVQWAEGSRSGSDTPVCWFNL